MSDRLSFRVRFPVQDVELSLLHSRAFAMPGSAVVPWSNRLRRHSLTWVGAFAEDALVGFVNVCWDGGSHAFLLDTAVDPSYQGRRIGVELVRVAAEAVRAAGCEWLHVDYESHLQPFYESACGFMPTAAGLLHLNVPAPG